MEPEGCKDGVKKLKGFMIAENECCFRSRARYYVTLQKQFFPLE